MTNLTKEDFWKPLQQNKPEQMEKFLTWIDEYKKRFPDLFCFGRKFHDLPIAMQWGVFQQYVAERSEDLETFHKMIEGTIKMIL